MFVTMLCYIATSMIYFGLSFYSMSPSKDSKDEGFSSNYRFFRILAVAAIIFRNIGATLASTLISFSAYKRNLNNEPHNPALALRFIDDFEVATVTTLTWQYFAVYILGQKEPRDQRIF